MSAVYLRDDQSRTTALARVKCTDEGKELHELLKANPDLLPGDQIDPEAPRRWLLIKHEMPVTDPATGSARWSIDLFFADQYGVPTLVECKRCDDTRSRREVVAQMLEYAANGHHYWTKSDMRSFAEAAAGGAEALQAKLNAIRGRDDQSAEEFFAAVEQNLREAKMRLVFFLEQSPNELRSLVDFMNKQLKDTEVILVEARQYQHGGNRIVVPWLFGYTEEARVAKRESRAETIRVAGERGEEPFWKAVDASGLPEQTKLAMRDLVAAWASGQLSQYGRVYWGAGPTFWTPKILPTRGLYSLRKNGALEMFFGYWDETKYSDVGDMQRAVREDFTSAVEQVLQISFNERERRLFPKVPPERWVPKLAQLHDAVLRILGKYHPK